jgi:hypothetical protein
MLRGLSLREALLATHLPRPLSLERTLGWQPSNRSQLGVVSSLQVEAG